MRRRWRPQASTASGVYGILDVTICHLANRNKLLKGGFSQKNAQTLKFKAGDLMFKTGASNGRYKGIYHVEMIIGYEFYGWDQNNKPVLLVKWANRPDGYYGYGIGIVGKM